MKRIELNLADLRQLPITHETTIPEEYLDAMGHMNVMWYTHLFSVAMGGMFQLFGLTWDRLGERQGGTFVLESHIVYVSEVRVGQTVTVHARLLGRTAKRFHALLFMINQQKGDLAATFEVVNAYIDMRARRMAPLPEDIVLPLDRLIAEHRDLSWPAPVCGAMAP